MKLDPYVPLEYEVMSAMFDLAQLKPDEFHIDLGSGDGQFIWEARARGANSIGYELNEELAEMTGVWCMDAFDADVSYADVISFWFTMPGTDLLLSLLKMKMKSGARLVTLYDSMGTGIIPNEWQPVKGIEVLGNKIWMYIKE